MHAVAQTAPAASGAWKLAVLMPAKDSPLEPAAQTALQGLMSANYASANPANIILVRVNDDQAIATALQSARDQGANVAVGPLWRSGVEQAANLATLPLPLVTLNSVDTYREVPLTELEKTQQASELSAQKAQEASEEAASHDAADSARRSTARNEIPGLVLAEDRVPPATKQEPRAFPQGMLMFSLAMDDDAHYVAKLALDNLARQQAADPAKLRVLLLDEDQPLQKRISEAFEEELTKAGYAPDRLTVDPQDFQRIRRFFELTIDSTGLNEKPVDRNADPAGWRRQQLRLQNLRALRRGQAALSKPPYAAVFLALSSNTASLVRARLPMLSRVWAAPMVNPGNPLTNSSARSLSYDLEYVSFVDSPLALYYDQASFAGSPVAVPASLNGERLFALGSDALILARDLAYGSTAGQFVGYSGDISYDLRITPAVRRHAAPAMVKGGFIEPMTTKKIVEFAPSLDQLQADKNRLAAIDAGSGLPYDGAQPAAIAPGADTGIPMNNPAPQASAPTAPAAPAAAPAAAPSSGVAPMTTTAPAGMVQAGPSTVSKESFGHTLPEQSAPGAAGKAAIYTRTTNYIGTPPAPGTPNARGVPMTNDVPNAGGVPAPGAGSVRDNAPQPLAPSGAPSAQ